MSAADFSEWPKYLHNHLVLAGFMVLVFALAVIFISKTLRERLLGLGLLFIIIILVIGFVITSDKQKEQGPIEAGQASSVSQKSKGDQSPNTATTGDVNMSFGNNSKKDTK